MATLFKAKIVSYDSNTREYYDSGTEIIINMDYVVSFRSLYLGSAGKRAGLGEIFSVSTTIDNRGYPINVTSKYLEEKLKSIGS